MGKTRIIALEGIDGSGKSTQLALLLRRLQSKGYTCAVKEFPVYDAFFGAQCGEYLSGSAGVFADTVDAKSMSLWYALDRWENFKNYQDAQSDYLIINRYVLSNAVYQTIRERDMGNELPLEWTLTLEHGHFGLPKPDAYVFLDVPAELSGRNVDKKGFRDYVGDKRDVYEASFSLQQRAREKYLRYAQILDNVLVVACFSDGQMLEPGTVADDVWLALSNRGLVDAT